MSPRFIKTTEPIPVPPRGSWRDRYDRGRGIEPPVKVSPGLIAFRGKHHRQKAALYHNAALEAGFQSELEGLRGFTHVFVAPLESPGRGDVQ